MRRIITIILVSLLSCTAVWGKISHELRAREHIVLASGVTLTPFIPDGMDAPTKAVIVCPGGSYHWLDEPTEGYDVAQWLQSNGIAAFVLRYNPGTSRHEKMYRSIFSAIKHVRTNAGEYNVTPDAIGAMGFSAGGHLVMSAAEFWTSRDERPDFVAPIYPVVTMNDPYVHKRSRRGLLNARERHSQSILDGFSLEKNIPEGCPPVFLLNCIDDPIVMYQNSELLDAALTSSGIQHTYIQYRTGGHGFGATASKQNPETSLWQGMFLDWLTSISL